MGFLDSFREFLLERFASMYSEPAASFLSGLLFGVQPNFFPETKEIFLRTGLLHILVVSGSNVSMLIVFLNFVFCFIRRQQRIYFLVPFVAFYIGLSGFSPPAIRAGIMGFLMIFALTGGRLKSGRRFLILAAVGMILFDPAYLQDLSFLLSVSATSGVLFLFPVLQKLVQEFYARFHERVFVGYIVRFLDSFLGQIFLLTISVEIMSLPILFYFEEFSVIAPFTNMLFLPFVPFFLLAGFASLFLPFLSSFLEFLIRIFFVLVGAFSRIPFATLPVPKFSWFFIILYYLLLGVFLFRRDKSGRCSSADRVRFFPPESSRQF